MTNVAGTVKKGVNKASDVLMPPTPPEQFLKNHKNIHQLPHQPMRKCVRLEGRPIGEALATHVAGVSECTRVGHHVPFKFLQDLELHVAYLALERDVDAVVSLGEGEQFAISKISQVR